MYERGMAVTAIAEKQGISRRTVADWAKAGGWQRPADRAAAAADGAGGSGGDHGDHGDQARRVAGPPDVDLILAETIADLRTAMDASLKNFDYRPIPNLATSIVKTLEAWEKRHPASPAALAQLAIEMGMKPRVFMEAVVEAWRLNSNGEDCQLKD